MIAVMMAAAAAVAGADVAAAGANDVSAADGVPKRRRPHIIALLADDLGWHDTAPRNPAAPTPVLAKLAREGITLDRHYVFRFCSPTRRALLTGRLPTSLTTSQPDGADLCSDFLPLALPLVSEVLAAAGYACHFIGKGHLGYETTDHLPVNRGFATHVGYLGGSEGYAHGGGSADSKVGKHDLWRDQGPAFEDTATMSYSTDAYAAEASKLISRHDAQEPMFMYLAFQSVHAPWTLPPAWQVRDYPDFPFQTYANMLALMDEGVGNVTRALQEAAMWEDTLLLFTSDNGGVGAFGNNFPLHGHKHDPYEGGTRAAALVAGGFVPQALRGTTSQALVHVADWFPTFAQLATGDAAAALAAALAAKSAGRSPPPIDGVDVLPMLFGVNATQPRPVTVVTEVSAILAIASGELWKLVTLAGQSGTSDAAGNQFNGTAPCLDSWQRDPPQPGRTDAIVNGPAYDEKAACAVCNETMHADPRLGSTLKEFPFRAAAQNILGPASSRSRATRRRRPTSLQTTRTWSAASHSPSRPRTQTSTSPAASTGTRSRPTTL